MLFALIGAVGAVSVLHFVFHFSMYRCVVGLVFAAFVFTVLGLGGSSKK